MQFGGVMKSLKNIKRLIIICILIFPITLVAQPQETVDPKSRCAVCGMMVAKYPQWVTQLKTPTEVLLFDGVKDMMAYYLEPEMYGGKQGDFLSDVYVKDYYSQQWIDALAAFYVIGGDVLGPMGHELIPFETKDGAENFLKDHKGREILPFSEISLMMVKKMKGGHGMKGHKMKK